MSERDTVLWSMHDIGLAGWCGGLVWALVCWLVARELQRRGKVEKADDRAANEPEFDVKP